MMKIKKAIETTESGPRVITSVMAVIKETTGASIYKFAGRPGLVQRGGYYG